MKKYPMETVVGIFVVVGLVCIGYMAINLGKVSVFEEDVYPLYARFTSVSGLRAGSGVEVYGIGAGRVKRLTIDSERQMALVEMEIKKTLKVYDDAQATVKTAGLIGDKFVKIDPGGAGEPLKPSGIITQTSVPPDVEDLIGKFAFGSVQTGQEKPPEKTSKEPGK
jgi:phospholipid/cholesterol/gamma-HCH transport system substrate-binding protein